MKQLFVLYDEKARSFGSPVVDLSLGSLIRNLADAVAAGDSVIAKHPEDFVLFDLGTFDDLNGSFSLVSPPIRVGTVKSLLPMPEGHEGALAPVRFSS